MTILKEFDVDGCRVCLDIQQWKDRAIKNSFQQKSKTTASSIEKDECPLDIETLGRNTWSFLHTMAAYYPEEATPMQQLVMRGFIKGLSLFYPCSHCASHFRTEIEANQPQVQGRRELSLWFCTMHNLVNERLGKPTFDCSRVLNRWRGDDPSDDSSC